MHLPVNLLNMLRGQLMLIIRKAYQFKKILIGPPLM